MNLDFRIDTSTLTLNESNNWSWTALLPMPAARSLRALNEYKDPYGRLLIFIQLVFFFCITSRYLSLVARTRMYTGFVVHVDSGRVDLTVRFIRAKKKTRTHYKFIRAPLIQIYTSEIVGFNIGRRLAEIIFVLLRNARFTARLPYID